MRVLHLIAGLAGGGTETLIRSICKRLEGAVASRLFTISHGTLYEGNSIPQFEPHAIPVLTVAEKARRVWDLRRLLQDWRPHIVHAHCYGSWFYAAVLGRIGSVETRTVAHWHYPSISRINFAKGALIQWALNEATAIIACSSYNASRGGEVYAVSPDKIHVVHNGVDVARFPAYLPEHASDHPASPATRALYLGNTQDIRRKGIDVLVAAANMISPGLEVEIDLVGPGETDELHSLLQACSLVNKRAPVAADGVPDLLRRYDVYVQPSRAEGFPLSILEAMASGLPIVATDVGGVSEAVEHGVTGLLVPPDEPAALAAAIEHLARQPEQRTVMGAAARRKVNASFTLDHTAEKLLEVYELVMD